MSGRSSTVRSSRQTPQIRQSRYQRVIDLSAVANAAVITRRSPPTVQEDTQDDDDTTDANDGNDDEELTSVTTTPQRRVFTNNIRPVPSVMSTTTTTTSRPSFEDYLAPGESYAYLWLFPTIRRYLTYIAIVSVILLLLNVAVFVMWFFGKIPGFPSSTMYYGFIMYFLFILAGVLSLCMSLSTSKTLYTITLIIVLVSFIMSIVMNYLIYRNIADCGSGAIASSCGSFYITQLVLLMITIAIAVALFVLLILFSIMWARIGQSFSAIDSLYS